ncbi:MAG: hypothetical protein ACFFBD_22470, partial [Candidatus Hodarchaeota archaeon]
MEAPEKIPLVDHIVSIVLILIIVVYLVLEVGQEQTFSPLPLFLFLIFLGLNFIGYLMLLNFSLSDTIKLYLKEHLKQEWLSIGLQWLSIPLLVVFSFVLVLLAGLFEVNAEPNFLPILILYLIYVIVPIAFSWITSQYLNNKSTPELRLFAGFLVLLWIWWFVEFSFLPSIIRGVSFNSLLGIITALWCFLIIINYEVPRSFSQLRASACWKTLA